MAQSSAFSVYRDLPSEGLSLLTSPLEYRNKPTSILNAAPPLIPGEPTLSVPLKSQSSGYTSRQKTHRSSPRSRHQDTSHESKVHKNQLRSKNALLDISNIRFGGVNASKGFKSRFSITKKPDAVCDTRQEIIDIDAGVRDNHLYVGEYIPDIYRHLKELEFQYLPSGNYMSKQKEMTTEYRAVLVDWLIEVCEDCQLVPETLFLMINYVDRFMSKKNVMKHQLQLLGLSAVFVASKYEEIEPVAISDLVHLAEGLYTAKQIILMEEQLLKCLKYGLNVATIRCFATRYIGVSNHMCHGDDPESDPFPSLVYYFSELSLLHYPMLKFRPSRIALACVVLALFTLRKRYWDPTIAHFSELEFSEILEPMYELDIIWRRAPTMKYNIVYKKYARSGYQRVSSIAPRSSLPADPTDSQWPVLPTLNLSS